MAAGVVRAAIAAILEDGDFVLNTPRMVTAKETAKKLIDAITADDHTHTRPKRNLRGMVQVHRNLVVLLNSQQLLPST